MHYRFKCPKCSTLLDVSLTISEYSKFKPRCKKCKVALQRVYEVPPVKTAGITRSDSSAGQHSCSGHCGSCESCGI